MRRAAVVVVAAGALLAAPAGARAPARMLVTAREWSLTLSRGTAPAGALTVQLYDRGQDAHNLNLRRLTRRGRKRGPAQRVALTQSGGLVSVAGGGDTVAALNHAGVADSFSFVSTAGGAFLEWMEGKALPGVAALG